MGCELPVLRLRRDKLLHVQQQLRFAMLEVDRDGKEDIDSSYPGNAPTRGTNPCEPTDAVCEAPIALSDHLAQYCVLSAE
jgi:hypothetical protein